MRNRKLTQRMWDVLTQWIGDTLIVGEWAISIRSGKCHFKTGDNNTFMIWVSVDFRGTNYAHIGLESKDIGETHIPIEILELLREAFDKRAGKHLMTNPCSEITLSGIDPSLVPFGFASSFKAQNLAIGYQAAFSTYGGSNANNKK